jgi:hypothetical protein
MKKCRHVNINTEWKGREEGRETEREREAVETD